MTFRLKVHHEDQLHYSRVYSKEDERQNYAYEKKAVQDGVCHAKNHREKAMSIYNG
jgi:hypothetical protein